MAARIRNTSARRKGLDASSVVMIQARCTRDELDAHHALAQYKGLSLSDLVRELLAEERARITATGGRVPRKPRV